MTEAQRRALTKNSECRSRLNELQTAAEPDSAAIEAAAKAYSDSEVEVRAALAADDEGEHAEVVVDAEERARRELRSKSRAGNFVNATIGGHNLTGVEAEYAAACKMPTGYMPIELLQDDAPELRAVTPGVTAPGATAAVAPVIFEATAAAALGVQFPVVEQGQANYPVLATAPTADTRAKGSALPSTAGAFRLDTRTPTRIGGNFEVRVEDLAVLPSMEEALRSSMLEVAGNAVDDQVIAGSGTAPDLSGLFHQAADVSAAGTTETFATGVSRFAALVDGKFAYGWGDIRAIVGSATFASFAGKFQTGGEISLYDYLASKLGAIRVSDAVPAAASNAQKVLVSLTARTRPIVAPIWRGVQLVRDPYSQAKEGIVSITAFVLVGAPHLPYSTNQIKELHPKIT